MLKEDKSKLVKEDLEKMTKDDLIELCLRLEMELRNTTEYLETLLIHQQEVSKLIEGIKLESR